MLKSIEFYSFSGSTYFLGGVVLSLFLFEAVYAAGGIIILSVGDVSAVLIGDKLGENKIFDKTIEGTGVFIIITSFILLLLTYTGLLNLGFMPVLGAVTICAIVELLPIGVDDNLMLPILGSALLSVLS